MCLFYATFFCFCCALICATICLTRATHSSLLRVPTMSAMRVHRSGSFFGTVCIPNSKRCCSLTLKGNDTEGEETGEEEDEGDGDGDGDEEGEGNEGEGEDEGEGDAATGTTAAAGTPAAAAEAEEDAASSMPPPR